jgi:hypothetical protein
MAEASQAGDAMITDTGSNICLVLSGGCLAVASTGQASWWPLLGSVLSVLANLLLTAWARRGPRRP